MSNNTDFIIRNYDTVKLLGQQFCILRLSQSLSLEELSAKVNLRKERLEAMEIWEYYNHNYITRLSRFYNKKIRINIVD